MADYRIEGVADLDARPFIRSIQALHRDIVRVGRDIDFLSKDIDALGAKSATVSVDMDTDGMAKIKEVKAQIEELDKEKATADVEVHGAAESVAEVEAVKHEVEKLDREKATVKVDTKSAVQNLQNFSGEVANSVTALGGVGRGGLIGAVAILATALIPMVPVVAGWGAGVAGAFAVAGAGAASFAAIAIPGIKAYGATLKELQKLQTKVDTAKDAKAKAKAMSDLKRYIDSIDPGLKKLIDKTNTFNKAWSELGKKLNPKTYEILSKGLDFVYSVLQLMAPVAMNVADALSRVMDKANVGIKGESWTKFFDYLKNTAGPMLEIFLVGIGNFITGIANMIVAFDPLSQSFAGGFAEMSAKFLNWSKTLDTNKGFQNFITYVQTNGPKVWGLLKSLGSILWDVGKSLMPLGSAVADFLTKFAPMVKSFLDAHPGILSFAGAIGAAALVVGPFASSLGGLVSGPLKGLVEVFGKGILGKIVSLGGFLQKAGLASAIAGGGLESFAGPLMGLGGILAGVSAPILIVVAALTAIGVGLAFAHQSGAKFAPMMAALGNLFGVVKDVAMSFWDTLKGVWSLLVQTGTIASFQEGIASLANAFSKILPILKPVAQILGITIAAALWAVGLAFKGFAAVVSWVADILSPIINGIVAVFKWMFDVLVGHSIIPDLINAISSWFQKLVGFVMTPVNVIKGAIVAAWNWIKGASSATWSAITGFVSRAISTVRSVVSSGVNTAKSLISSAWNTAKSLTSTAWSTMTSAVSTGIGKVVSFVKGLPGKILGALGSLGSLLWGAGSALMGGLKSGIEAGWGAIKSSVSSMGQWIKDHKGPRQYDLNLLKPAGGWIMQGLSTGLENNMDLLHGSIAKITNTIADTKLPALAGAGSYTANGTAGAVSALTGGGGSNSGGDNTYIGLYMQSGAIQMTVEDKQMEGRLTQVLTRTARFGQFRGPAGSNK